MTIDPLPGTDDRLEQLFFADGSGLVIGRDFRSRSRAVYLDACKKAVRREFIDQNITTNECAICGCTISASKMFCAPCIALEAAKQGRKM